MENQTEMLELLRSMEKTGRQKRNAAILICACMLVAAVSCVVLCVTVCTLVPRVSQILDQVQRVLGNLEALDLQQTMDKLNTIDIETLNKAIGDLSRVIEPLAKFVSKFS